MVVSERQQGQEARALDGQAELTLITSLGTGQTSRHDFGVFSDVVFQNVDIFVVDLFNFFCREAAELAALEEAAATITLVAFVFLLGVVRTSSQDGFLRGNLRFLKFNGFEVQDQLATFETLGSEEACGG